MYRQQTNKHYSIPIFPSHINFGKRTEQYYTLQSDMTDIILLMGMMDCAPILFI